MSLNRLKNNILVLRNLTGLNQSQFGSLFGLTRDHIASYERGSEPKLTTLLSIVNHFRISVEQIINEDLSKTMVSVIEFRSLDSAITEHAARPLHAPNDTQGNENIIFVPVKASAGYLNGYADPKYMSRLPTYRLPGISNGFFRMFEISGQSMKETLEDGDKIVGQWVLPEDIKDGRVYIIVSKTDGICAKRCINRLKRDNRLILQSDNKEFDKTIINAEDILEVWSAKLRLTRKFDNSSLTLNRFAEKVEDILEAWSAKQMNISKLNDLSKALERTTELETRLAFIEKNLLNKP